MSLPLLPAHCVQPHVPLGPMGSRTPWKSLSVCSLHQDYAELRGVLAVGCAMLTLPVFALLAFTSVPPLVSTIWLRITYSFAAVSSQR